MKRFVKQLIYIGAFAVSVLGATVTIPQTVAAASPITQFAACGSQSNFFGFPAWDACLPKENGKPVIKALDDVWKIAFPIVETMIKATGYIAVGFIIWGGIKYTKSGGEPGNISGAQATITNAIIGLVIAVLSVVIVRFVADRFNG